eukprot:TRINITY_DN2242_c0_g2_i1.p1 TRINITY_DN2242_c0_g2~~TRINITY_DN2242_c0_g2_i1.p1  ORF type:complete len:248 (+),score=80.51 TRINITY_DN2242_c0_g2_i1:39-782(+)
MTKKTLVLFDIDGTLTPARGRASEEMLQLLQKLKTVVDVGIVGGSDASKQIEQLGDTVHSDYHWVFAENGLVGFKNGEKFHAKSILDHLTEEQSQEIVNFCLNFISSHDVPKKRGVFVEYRTGMINVSPCGRSVSQKEREQFFHWDNEHKLREEFKAQLDEKFGGKYNLTVAIGGQISMDIFPNNWDKTYCLQFVEEYDEVHFFGDRTAPGGNDYEIFEHLRTIGHTVTSPQDTIEQLDALFNVRSL